MIEVKAHRQRLVTRAAGRLARPMLSGCVTLWVESWREETRARELSEHEREMHKAESARLALSSELDRAKAHGEVQTETKKGQKRPKKRPKRVQKETQTTGIDLRP